MKKIYLILIVIATGISAFGQNQPNNVDIGLFPNGSHGSNAGSGASVAISLRPRTGTYTATPTAQSFVVILFGPSTLFAETDVVTVSQYNPAIFGTNTMDIQAPTTIGSNVYFPMALSLTTGLNLSSMTLNNWSFAFTIAFSPAKSAAALQALRIVDRTNNNDITVENGGVEVFSTLDLGIGENQLTNGAFTTLPASLTNFSGYKSGSKNILKWTTASESNNKGFRILRSSDGTNYTPIGFVNSLANSGNSSTELSYSFDDNTPVTGKKNYYRLSQEDLDGGSKLSNIVLINGDKPVSIAIGAIFPNPARSEVNLVIDAPRREDVTIMVMDLSGKTLSKKSVNVEIGSNTVPVEIGNLTAGSYLVRVTCKSGCETAVSKFVKQ
jgi:hypothetical protein